MECIFCGKEGSFGFKKIGSMVKSEQRTIMACIITCVPNMANVMTPNDLICPMCKAQLLAAVKFHEKCSQALTKLEARKNGYTINLNGPLGDPGVLETQNSHSVDNFINELGNEIDEFGKELDETSKELETISHTLNDKHGVKREYSPEMINLELATDTLIANFEDSKPYGFVPILKVFVKQEHDITSEICIDNLKDSTITELCLQDTLENEDLEKQAFHTESVSQIEKTASNSNWCKDRIVSFRPSLPQWTAQENNFIFLSCSGIEDNIFKLSLDLNKAGVEKVFISPLHRQLPKRIIFLGSRNVSNSMIKPNSTASEIGFTCVRCGQVCDDEVEYKIHYYGNHKKKCPECDNFKPNCMSMLKSHTCEKCNESFKTKLAYEGHVERYADLPACYFECQQCHAKFKTKNLIEAHIKNHNSPKICKFCSKEFKTKAAVSNHIRNVHMERTVCPICGNMYSNVKNHMREHMKKGLTFMCDECPTILKSSSGLKKHKLAKHIIDNTVPKPHCDLCNITFSSETSKKAHDELRHNKKEKFKCDICKEQFVRKDYWQRHMEMHSKYGLDWRQRHNYRPGKNGDNEPHRKKRKYILAQVLCKICNKAVNRCSYKKHYNKHLNYRPFKCKHCPMKFFCKTDVTKHEKLHDDPTYKIRCEICNKKFENKDLLSRHLKKHDLRYPCDICGKKFGRRHLLEMHKVNDHADEENEEEKKAMLEEMLQEVVRVVPEQKKDEYSENEMLLTEEHLAIKSLEK